MAKQKKEVHKVTRDIHNSSGLVGWEKYLLYALCSEMARRGEYYEKNVVMAAGLYIEKMGSR